MNRELSQAAVRIASDNRGVPVLVAAVLTMSAAQLLDLASFVTMVKALGPAAEANPLMAFLFGSYGYPMVAIAKVVLLAFTTAIATLRLLGARPRPRLAATVVAVGIIVGLVGGLSNSVALGAI